MTKLPSLSFNGCGSFAPRASGTASGLLSHNGDYKVTISSATPGTSNAGNAQVAFVCVVQDEDNKGVIVKSWVPYSGNDKNGKANAERLWEVLSHTGTTAEQFAALDGKDTDIDEVCQLLTGRTAFVHCDADEYNGRWSSSIRWWISEQKLGDQKAVGAHRTPLPAGAGAMGVSTAAPANGSVITTMAAVPAVSTTVAAGNPLL